MSASILAQITRTKFRQVCRQLDAQKASKFTRDQALIPFYTFFHESDAFITAAVIAPCRAGERVEIILPGYFDVEGDPVTVGGTAFTSTDKAGDDADIILDPGESVRTWAFLTRLHQVHL